MDRNRIEGAAEKAKGAVKDATGRIIGNDRLRAEGKMDKAKGEVKEAAGKIADKAREAIDRGLQAVRRASKH